MNVNQVEDLVETKEVKKIFSKIGCSIIFSIIIMSVIVAVMMVIAFITDGSGTMSNFVSCMSILSNFIITYPLIYVMLRHLPRQCSEKKDFSNKELLSFFVIGMFISLAGGFIGEGLAYLLSRGKAVNPVEDLILGGNLLLQALGMCVLAPVFEELIFRKLFIDIIAPYSEKRAVIFTAFCFALVHMNLFQMFYAFGLGLLLGYIYIKSRKITYTIALHFGYNFIGGLIPMFFRESPAILAMHFYVSVVMAVIGMMVFFKNREKFKLHEVDTISEEENTYSPMFFNAGTILFTSISVLAIVFSLRIT